MPEVAELERNLADLERDLGAERTRVDFLERRMPSDRGGKPLLIGDGHPHAQAIEGLDEGTSQGFGYRLDAVGTGVALARSGRTLTLTSTKYTDAEAIAAVEGEATLLLSGAVDIDGALEVAGILTINVIDERTPAAGVTVDGVLLKDGLVDGVDVAARDHAKYTDAEAITAVEGEATLDLAGAVAVTGDLTLTASILVGKPGIEDDDGVQRITFRSGFPFFGALPTTFKLAVSGNTVIIE
ncbi:hypothetical protein LCGC14_2783050, partial [marine sediment metagenome]